MDRFARWASSRAVVIAAFAVLALSAGIAYLGRVNLQHLDLEVYRYAVQAWWDGRDPYGPLPATNGGTGLQLPFIYPPFALVMAVPFAAVPWGVSYFLLFALSSLCVFGTLYAVGRHLAPDTGRNGALIIACAGTSVSYVLEPVRETFEFGQINLLLMGLVAIDCLAPRTRWPRGVGVGIAAAIKLTPAAFLLFFLLRKDFRAAAVTVVTGVVATGIGFLATTTGSLHYWLDGFAGAAGVSGSTYRTNQTLLAMFGRLAVEQPWLKITVYACLLVILVLVILAMRRSTPPVALLVCAAFSLLASPTAWSHHWVWIVPAVVVLVAETARRLHSPHGWALCAGTVLTLAAFTVAPFHLLPGNDDWTPAPVDIETLWTPWQHLIGNSYVLLGVVWIVVCAAYKPAAPNSPAVRPSGARAAP